MTGAMVVFPRVMISVVGAALVVILVLAGRNAFPAHARIAEAAGVAIGAAINLMLQFALWSNATR
jgi:hypothetical protein